MSTTVKRLVAVLLGVLGLVLGVGGLWFVAHLGGSGIATFRTTLSGSEAIVIPPSVLNRVPAPVTVSVQGSPGSAVWIGASRPSDATSAVGAAAHRQVTGVDVSDWTLHVGTAGTGKAASFARADVWHTQQTGTERVSLTLEQANAPETVVVAVDKGSLTDLTISFERKAWFVQSVVAALIGLFLLLAGILTWRLDLRSRGTSEGSRPAGSPAAHARTEEGSE